MVGISGSIANKLIKLRKEFDPCRPCDNDKTIVPINVTQPNYMNNIIQPINKQVPKIVKIPKKLNMK